MKKVIVIGLIVGGAWWYATKKFKFDDTLAYAKAHPEAKWAPAVEYSVGMVYYQRTDYPKAQAAFAQLLTDFPTSQYTAHALLRLSEAAEENRDWDAAKQSLDQFLNDFPDDPDRNIAQKRRELLYNK